MKLSDYKNEDAIDVLADLIEPASVIMADKEIADLARSGKPKLLIVRQALRSHKKEVIEIVAAIHRKDPSEVQFNAISLVGDALDILNDPEIQQVFTLQGQTADGEHSGTVMEATTGSAQ